MAEPSLIIPRDIIEPLLQAKIAESMLAVLGDRAAIIDATVAKVLMEKVDDRGNKSNYNSAIPWIQYIMEEVIQEACKEAIIKWSVQAKEQIEEVIMKQLGMDKRRIGPLAKTLIDAMTNQLRGEDLRYSIKVSYGRGD